MTVQTNDSGFVDYSQPGAIPDIADTSRGSSSSRNNFPTNRYEMYPHKYTARSRPVVSNINFFGKNGFYMNGPAADPYSYAQTQRNIVDSYTQSWTDQAKRTTLESFSQLLSKYGHTNSAGTLWALANSNLDPSNPAVQQMLAVDSRAAADEYGKAQPTRASAPAATEEASWTDSMWQPLEFASRNAFAALSMPMEALQGTIRGIGGELTKEGGPDIGGAVAELGSLVFPPIALWADRVRGDNEFINPWEQTEFGQTLLSASGGAGFQAFTTKQAGLDVERAREELLQDPIIAAQATGEKGIAALNALAEKMAQEKGYYSDPGWFIDETSIVGEAQRRATFDAWAIPGKDGELTAWTLGRGIFSNVGGPDWVGYGVASGIVDAAAAILLDPTIIGAKLGLPSKAVKGLSTIVRGTDGAILIGKERRAAEAAAGVANRQMQAAQAVAAAGEYRDAERVARAQLRRDLGREPTQGELEAVVGPAPVVDPTDLALMDLAEQANVVKQSIIADHTTETLAAVRPDIDGFVAGQARDIRRSMATYERADRVLTRDVVTNDTIADPAGSRQMWEYYIAYTFDATDKTRISLDEKGRGFYKFTEDVLGYDRNGPGTGYADVANAQTFSDLSRRQAAWALENGFDDPGSYDAARGFLDQIDSLGSRSVKRPKEIPADRVERDAARLLTDDNTDAVMEALSQRNIMGANLAAAPTKAAPALGMVDGVKSIVYWTGRQEPKLLLASDIVPTPARDRIARELQNVLNRPEMRLADTYDDVETLAGQVASQIDTATDPSRALADLMTVPDLTWERLLDEVARMGLDGVFDDILRNLPRGQRADGIDKLRFGTWMGDHPNMSAYQISGSQREAAAGIKGTDDIEAALANLAIDVTDQIPVGFRSLNVDDLEQIRNTALTQATAQMDGLRNYRADRIMEANRQESALNQIIADLDAKFADPEQALKETLRYDMGLRNSRTGSLTLDDKQVRKFLFGSGPTTYLANRALDALSDFIPEATRLKALDHGADSEVYRDVLHKAMGELHIITNGKLTPDLYKAMAENAIEGGGRTGLINILAPRLGVDVSRGGIGRTINTVGGDGNRYFRSWRAPSPVIARALGQMPTPRKVNLQNADEVAESIMLYGRYGKVDEDILATMIGKVLAADGGMDSVGINRNALLSTFNAISNNLLTSIDESKFAGTLYKGRKGQERLAAIKEAIQSSTRLYLGGMTDEASSDVARFAADAEIPRIITSDGKEIPLPSLQIDTELAQGFIGLPSVDEWSAALNRFTLAVSRTELTANTYDIAKRFFDNFFRTSLLVLRVSYVIRNAAEMQVRMFLNGHQSVLSDPLTMMGMTIGNLHDAKQARKYREAYQKAADDIFAETGEKASKSQIEAIVGEPPKRALADLYAPYKNTVLGTDFEVGMDEALAVTNHVEDYFTRIRLAHSLTDPRVYNSAIRQGWKPVGYGTPTFNKGWAHELIMLQRSGVARLVVGPTSARTSGVVNAGMNMGEEEIKALALMNDPEYDDLRKLLIGADERFKEILGDFEATKMYLFDPTNGVWGRIKQFTGDNPQLLEYLRTGRLEYGNRQVLDVNNLRTPEDRIKGLSTVLGNHFNGTTADGFNWAEHFVSNKVTVPWIENIDKRPGIGIFNKFFDWANKIERLGAVGPEYRLAYWDKIAELAPGLRGQDVERALKAARTTLSPLKRMAKGGQLDDIGSNHPAFAALKKASQNDGGLLTLDEIHGIASSYAAEIVTDLFYDAARRNNAWNAMRLLFPFGQAWGNTIATWTKLGKKNPIQVYKAQKAFNALLETGSSAVYEFGSDMGAYGQYAPGFAPWEQDTNGGFFYTDSFGETSFMYPFIGRIAALPLNVWAQFAGSGSPGVGEVAMQSPAASLNLALGADSIFPGIGPIGALPLATGVLPDNEVTASLRQIAAPFGEKNIIESMVPSWFSKVLGGVGAVPGIGDVIGPWVDVLSPANKNKGLRDAMMILSTSGNYQDWATNDQTARRLRDDAAGLGKALLLTTGIFQNVMPSTPYTQTSTPLTGDQFKGKLEEGNTALYTISMMNALFQQYRSRNGFDDTAAREEFVKDFGPAALFATTGDWKNFSRVPTSQALEFARKYPEIAKANMDEFTLFFPQGDSSDVAAMMWIRKYGMGERTRKNKDEIFDEIVGFLARVQRNRIDSMEANDLINEAEAQAARDEVDQRYIETGATTGVFVDKSAEMEKLNAFVNRYDVIQNSQAGQAFVQAWTLRSAALGKVREQSGRSNAGLGSKQATPVLEWYLARINEIEAQYPDFKLLAGKFRREWE